MDTVLSASGGSAQYRPLALAKWLPRIGHRLLSAKGNSIWLEMDKQGGVDPYLIVCCHFIGGSRHYEFHPAKRR